MRLHPNAKTTPTSRSLLVRRVLLDGRRSRRLSCLAPCLQPGCRRRSWFEHEKKCEEVVALEYRIALDMMERNRGVSE